MKHKQENDLKLQRNESSGSIYLKLSKQTGLYHQYPVTKTANYFNNPKAVFKMSPSLSYNA